MRKHITDLHTDFNRLLNTISDAGIKSLVCHAMPSEFMDAPGGAYKHHAYATGLLEHTIDVAEIAVSMLESATDASQYEIDVMLGACLMHDYAKVNEYRFVEGADGNTTIAYGDFSIGHVVESVCMMAEANAIHKCCPRETLDDIKRLMLAHHGFHEWGTPSSCDVTNMRKGQPTASVAQCIIHSADMASAQNANMPERVKNLLK